MSARRTLLISAPLMATVLLLSACVPAGDSEPTSSASPRPTVSATPTGTATASATPETPAEPEVETGEPVGLSCNDVVTPQQIYDYNPNFGLVDGFVPESGSLAGQAVAANGLACRWMNQTSGATIDVSVAHLDARSDEIRKEFLASNSTSVSDFGPNGYFDQGDVGSAAQAFPGEFWVTAASVAFFTAEDAAAIMGNATAAVG
ncbi:hypothetical protein IWX81_000965 [Salinibacterium sp. CAN_S4]|uniref:arginyl-tRNA synthetase n=1 Tax=Salinibacterium sp. CAN_S4 TaxID=2787727 RepID=UPI0018F0077A